MTDFSAERMADGFAAHLRDHHADKRHVFRVITWLGMLSLAIEQVKSRWWVPRTRQLFFEDGLGHRYKVRYNHTLRPRGGIEIVTVERTKGQREIDVVAEFYSLEDVEIFYDLCAPSRSMTFPAILKVFRGDSPRPVTTQQTEAHP